MNIEKLRNRAEEAAAFLKALGNANRLLIVCELHLGERSVGALEQAVGLGQSALSQHLARLRADGLVKTRREAQIIHYSLADDRVRELTALLYDLYCRPRRR